MTELVALAAIVAAVAIVAIVVGRPFQGKASSEGIELNANMDLPRATKATRKRQKK